MAFFRALFAARTDVYAVRWKNARTRQAGWMPAIRGRWRKGIPAAERQYLPLTNEVIRAHLSGELELGLYPLLEGDRCSWLAADFDGPAAMLDALAYLKVARAVGAPVALEVSRSGVGAHVWLFFTTVFLDLATLEPHEDQWAYLSSLGRLSPGEVDRLARRLGTVTVGASVDRLRAATSTRIEVEVPAVVHAEPGSPCTLLIYRRRCWRRSSTRRRW